MGSVPSEFIEKIIAYVKNISSISWITLAIGALSIIILVLLPKLSQKIPASLVAIIVATALVKLLDLPVATIGSVFGSLSSKFPTPSLPSVNFEMIKNLISPAFTIALLAGIESLLSFQTL